MKYLLLVSFIFFGCITDSDSEQVKYCTEDFDLYIYDAPKKSEKKYYVANTYSDLGDVIHIKTDTKDIIIHKDKQIIEVHSTGMWDTAKIIPCD